MDKARKKQEAEAYFRRASQGPDFLSRVLGHLHPAAVGGRGHRSRRRASIAWFATGFLLMVILGVVWDLVSVLFR